MKLTEIKNDLLGERYYTATHPSGLQILLIPRKSKTFYAVYGARVGSIDCSFSLDGEAQYVDLPDGIAHFLEHKMFECEEGDAFLRYSETGASANAYTSFDKTCYLFSCTDHFYDNLDILLDFVQRPYYTKETVDKEQGIIGQEIKMYEDDPGWSLYQNLREALYHANPIRVDIAGTVESISHITPELLYRCYETFYNPANMVLSLCGDFDVGEALGFIEPRIKDVKPKTFTSRPFTEPREVLQKRVERRMPVAKPMIEIGYKCPVPTDKKQSLLENTAANVALEALFGHASRFYCDHYDAGDFSANFEAGYHHVRNARYAIIEGETDDPEKFEKLVREHLAEAKKTGLSPDDFEIARRKLYGDEVRSFEATDEIAEYALNTALTGDRLFDWFDTVRALTVETCNEVLRRLFDEDASAVSVVLPLNEKEVSL